MFDPTVFDNLKVVIEGYIYEMDIDHQISVTDRSDIIDLATMSRKYSISFKGIKKKRRIAKLQIEMPHHELSGELLQTKLKPGCIVKLFFLETQDSKEYDEILYKKLKKSWGDHPVTLFLTKEITASSYIYHHKYQVEFQTSFGEDDLEELVKIVDYAIALLGLPSKKS
ncbi:MAG TPA: hypothetical protein VEY70_12675 [Metabacillus sp.]|nr:hypothetical protein [Metabacillus sp.]